MEILEAHEETEELETLGRSDGRCGEGMGCRGTAQSVGILYART